MADQNNKAIIAAAGPAPLPELTGPSAQTDLSKRLRMLYEADTSRNIFLKAADEIDRLQTVKSHLILQAQIWHCEAKAQRATVIDILARLGLPQNDWEAKRLIVAHIAKLTGAPVPRPATSPSPAPAEPQELTLKDLAGQFFDSAESGAPLRISADSAALLFAVMTTPPTCPVEPERNLTLRVSGRPFRCKCGCNVFQHPTGKPSVFKCNSCAIEYEGDDE